MTQKTMQLDMELLYDLSKKNRAPSVTPAKSPIIFVVSVYSTWVWRYGVAAASCSTPSYVITFNGRGSDLSWWFASCIAQLWESCAGSIDYCGWPKDVSTDCVYNDGNWVPNVEQVINRVHL